MTLAIKFTGVGGTARFGNGSLCPPGESMPSTGTAESCVRGYHAARRASIAQWFGPEAYLVRLSGPANDSADKLCRAECHVVARLVWSAADSADYALACARAAAASSVMVLAQPTRLSCADRCGCSGWPIAAMSIVYMRSESTSP